MALDPRMLTALLAREKSPPPLGGAPMDEDLEEEPMEGEEAVGEEEFFIELNERELEDIAQMVEDGEGDDDLYSLAEQLVEAMTEAEEEGEELENPPEWAASPTIWDKAEAAVDPEGKGSKYSEPYAVVAHVYKRMGGRVK